MGTGEDSQEQRESSDESSVEDCFRNLMDLKECIQDSPNFRQQLRSREHEINDLEQKLEKVVNMCDRMVSTGNCYMEASRSFSVSLRELSSHFRETEIVSVTLKKFYDVLSELQSYYSIFFDQAQKSVQATLRAYLSGELRKVKETKKHFHRVSEELGVAINRNGHTPKSKPVEAEEASVHLLTVQNQFSHLAVDYSYHVNTITCNKSYEITYTLLEFMRAQFILFQNGYDRLHKFDPSMKKAAEQVDLLRKNATTLVQEMQSRHNLVSLQYLQEDAQVEGGLNIMDNPSLPIQLSGYLFKRPQSSNNPFKSWSRRWFVLNENKLVYESERKDEDHVTVAEDLRICTVKLAEDMERRFCFEVVTPTRSCMLQADSEMLRKKWFSYLEAGIVRALRISTSSRMHEEIEDLRKQSVVCGVTPIQILSRSPTCGRTCEYENAICNIAFNFLEAPGNSRCADCDNFRPTWASINLGIMLCIECSGIHRGMGVHISKVRSVTLDDWDPELQQIMCALGNMRVNAIYEYDLPKYVKKPTSESSMAERETYIRQKYVQHAFIQPHPDFQQPTTPLTPLSIPELLRPISLMVTPKSSNKRSFSPASMRRHMRSPRLAKHRYNSRPSSSTSNITDLSTPTGSEEDLRRPEICQSYDPSSGLHLLAENFRKMEDREKKAGGAKSIWGASLGDKLKSARRSSKRISSYAMSKLGEGPDSFLKRLKKPTKDRGAEEMAVRDVHSDTEEDILKSGTPLLYSLSASTHNLSTRVESSPSLESPVPPPKPPRTFKVKNFHDLSFDDEKEEEEEDDLPFSFEEDNFSMDVLAAINQAGVICPTFPGSGMGNGCIPSSSSSTSTLKVEGNHMLRSESSPQLSRSAVPVSLNLIEEPCSNRNSLSETPTVRLQTISEDSTDNVHIESFHDDEQNIIPLPHSSPTVTQEDRLVHSAPLRRKHLPIGPTTTSPGDSSTGVLSSAYSNSNGHLGGMSLDLSLTTHPKSESTPTPDMTKRFSMVSITSAEYYSAESSDVSKANSASPSPELFTKSLERTEDNAYFNTSFLGGVGGERGVVRPASCDGARRGNGRTCNRESPSLSVEDESFNTPPSSPSTPSPNESQGSPNLSGSHTTPFNDHVTITGNAEESHVADNVDSTVVMDILELELKMEDTIDHKLDMVFSEESEDIAATGRVTPKENVRKRSQNLSNSGTPPPPGGEENRRGEVRVVGGDELLPSKTPKFETECGFDREMRSRTATVPLPSKEDMRKRTLTTPNIDALPSTCGRERGVGGDRQYLIVKDDMFETKDDGLEKRSLSVSDSLVSSFSVKDLEDILGRSSGSGSLPQSRVETVREEEKGNWEGPEKEELEEGEELEKKKEGVRERTPEVESERGEESIIGEELSLKCYTITIPDSVAPGLFLFNSVIDANLPGILCALAHGGSVNFINEEEESRTPILQAIDMGSNVLVEYLYLNGAKLSATDVQGKGCLHYAAMQEETSLVMLLLKKGATPGIKDLEGRDPAAYALNRRSAHILNMLRVALSRADSRTSEDLQSLDELDAEFYHEDSIAQTMNSSPISKRASTPSIEGSISLDSK